jgi:hypothetical protein
MAKYKPPKTLNVVHLPGLMYGERRAVTPHPTCPECKAVFVNTSKQYSSCPAGHGGLRTPLVETGKWTPLSNEKIADAANAGTLLLGQILNEVVGKAPKHPKDVTKGQRVK